MPPLDIKICTEQKTEKKWKMENAFRGHGNICQKQQIGHTL